MYSVVIVIYFGSIFILIVNTVTRDPLYTLTVNATGSAYVLILNSISLDQLTGG